MARRKVVTKSQKLKMPKSKPETKRKKEEVLELYKNGWSRKAISEHLQEKYKLGHSQAYAIVRQALLELTEAILQTDKMDIRTAQLERAEELLRKAIEAGDLKTAIKAQDMVNKLNLLYVEKQEIKADAKIETWTFEYGE